MLNTVAAKIAMIVVAVGLTSASSNADSADSVALTLEICGDGSLSFSAKVDALIGLGWSELAVQDRAVAVEEFAIWGAVKSAFTLGVAPNAARLAQERSMFTNYSKLIPGTYRRSVWLTYGVADGRDFLLIDFTKDDESRGTGHCLIGYSAPLQLPALAAHFGTSRRVGATQLFGVYRILDPNARQVAELLALNQAGVALAFEVTPKNVSFVSTPEVASPNP